MDRRLYCRVFVDEDDVGAADEPRGVDHVNLSLALGEPLIHFALDRRVFTCGENEDFHPLRELTARNRVVQIILSLFFTLGDAKGKE